MFLKYIIICSHVYDYSNKSLTPLRLYHDLQVVLRKTIRIGLMKYCI